MIGFLILQPKDSPEPGRTLWGMFFEGVEGLNRLLLGLKQLARERVFLKNIKRAVPIFVRQRVPEQCRFVFFPQSGSEIFADTPRPPSSAAPNAR